MYCGSAHGGIDALMPGKGGSDLLFSHVLFDELHLDYTVTLRHSSKPHRMPPHVDVVVVFRAASNRPQLPKEQIRKNVAKTERQYTALINTLTRAGLRAVGRRGENQDQLLILVTCPPDLFVRLVHCERSVRHFPSGRQA